MSKQIKACHCDRYEKYVNFNSKGDICDLRLKCLACSHSSDFREDRIKDVEGDKTK